MKPHLRSLIAKNKTKQVIQDLSDFAARTEDHGLQNEVIMQSSRHEEFLQAKRMELASSEELSITKAKINNALLAIIEKLPDSATKGVNSASSSNTQAISPDSAPQSNRLWKTITAMAVVIGILGSLAEIFNYIDLIPTSADESGQLTIYVHGENGPQDYILENSGELLVDLDGDRRSAKIGEKGRTVFNEIPAKFKGQTLPITVKANGYEAMEANKQYTWEGRAIYLAIQKDAEFRRLKGMVKSADGNEFLANVLVVVENELDSVTDELGRFSLTVPNDQVQDKYSITFKKDGYQTTTEFYYPKSSSEFRMVKK